MRVKSRLSTLFASALIASLLATGTVPAQAETITSPASATSTAPTAETPQAAATPHRGPVAGQAVTYGLKSIVVKKALQGVASAIRGGASKFIGLADKWLDKKAADTLRKDSVRIADAVDDVANLPDIASHQVRSEVYKRLSTFMDHGTANVIANAVEGVLWLLL